MEARRSRRRRRALSHVSFALAVGFVLGAGGCTRPQSGAEVGAEVEEVSRADLVSFGALPRAEHALLVLELSPTGLRVASAHRVAKPLPKRRGHASLPWLLHLESASGELLHTVRMPAATIVRGEFQDRDGDEGQLSGVRQVLPRGAFAVRLPLTEERVHLRLLGPAGTRPSDESSAGLQAANATDRVQLGELELERIPP